MGTIVIRMAYGLMMVGMLLCFYFSKSHLKDIRKAANEFAFAFAKLSNHICPNPPKKGLAAQQNADGTIAVLPAAQQSEPIQVVLRRAGSEQAVELFRQMNDAAELVAKRAGFNRTQKAQFRDPLDEVLMMTHVFLVGCESPEKLTSAQQLEQFNSFLMQQPEHRMTLLKRITGDEAEAYRALNRNYATQMEEIERKEKEARAARKAGKPLPEDSAPAKEEPAKAEPAKAEEAGEQKPAESGLSDEWRGWGCG